MKTQNINDIKCWLQSALVNENLVDFSVDVLGNSEKGDGYLGDIVFVKVKGKSADNKIKTYDLVLKCSKKSQAFRDTLPVKDTFENEIYVYSEVFPAFRQFQIEKGVESVFDSVPKYYGKFISDTMEVLVLQNLRSIGYSLYDRKKPLTLDHIKLLMREYGKWHAISAAMQDQQPEKFKQLVGGIRDVWKKFNATTDVDKLFTTPVEDIYNLTKQDLTDHSSQKLKQLKDQVNYIIEELAYEQNHFSAISHGDNWNNNFMFKYEEAGDSNLVKVAMLDWQISRLVSPVLDLSYFLYACISPEDLKKFDYILKEYHESFSNHLAKLGSDAEKIFPYKYLLEDWRKFGKFGIVMAITVVKIALSDKDEVQDIAETLESGGDFSSTFAYEIKDKEQLKSRLLAVIEHAVDKNII